MVNRDLSIAVLRLFERRRRAEAAAGAAPRPHRPRASTLGALDLSSPLLRHLLPAEALEELKASVAAANAAAEAGDDDRPRAAPGAVPEADAADDAAAGAAAADGAPAPPAAHPPQPPPPPLRILEGLAASGLRSFRYAAEVHGVGIVVANDLDARAGAAIRRNAAWAAGSHLPAVVASASKVLPHQADARVVMLTHEKLFDVVDIDPYGTPCALLDAAVQAVSEGGLLCVTATDMAVLCGNASEVCWTKYGSYPLKMKACHEGAIRALLASIQAAAVRHKRVMSPLISVSVDFYVRVFVRVRTAPIAAKRSASQHSYVFQCSGCEARTLQPLGRVVERPSPGAHAHDGGHAPPPPSTAAAAAAAAGDGDDAAMGAGADAAGAAAAGASAAAAAAPSPPPPPPSLKFSAGSGPAVGATCVHCGGRHTMGGPLWSDPIHDSSFVTELRTLVEEGGKAAFPGYDKVHALLAAVDEELNDVVLYDSLHAMASVLRCTPPPSTLVRSALLNAGYRASGTHACALGLKTDAPPSVLWDILRCWVAEHPVKDGRDASQPGSVILSSPPTLIANFSRARGAVSRAQEARVPRFPNNPEPNWGPKQRAGRKHAPPAGEAGGEAPAKRPRGGDGA